jgi:phosphoribosyl 1,2-cyclic phosphodiesterase
MEFTVTYWGATGSLTAPLRPATVSDKMMRAVKHLLSCGALKELGDSPSEEQVRQCLDRHLPFHLRCSYGGNTSCAEIQTADSLLVLDSGSGFRELGIELNRRWNAADFKGPRKADVLFTHAHMDHTYATPFVDPYYDPRNHFNLWGTPRVLDSLRAVLDPASPLRGIYFPPAFDMMAAIRGLHEVVEGGTFAIGDTRIRTYVLNHPGGCLAYRFERGNRSLVFASDHEPLETPDLKLAEFARDADLFYVDAQYLDGEYRGEIGICADRPLARRGWGHGTVEGCIATAAAAGARRLHLGHHEPKRSDEELERIEGFARELMEQVLRKEGRPSNACEVRLAYEGLTVSV